MTQFLTIRNSGEVAIENLTVWGVSASRGNSDKIGQFGSGAKHGVLTCLREGVNPFVYSGRTKVSYSTEPAGSYNKVFVQVGTKRRESDVSLEFGALDWNDVGMAMREFISNALDASNGDAKGVEFKVCERVTPQMGTTVVAVPYTPAVQKYFAGLKDNFLHFGPNADCLSDEIIPKAKEGKVRIYRKGVFVREVGSSSDPNSLFDYNLGEEVKIDEARNMDDYAVASAVTPIFGASPVALLSLFQHLDDNNWEVQNLFGWRMVDAANENKGLCQEARLKVFCVKAVACPKCSYAKFASAAENDGYTPILISNNQVYEAVKTAKIRTIYDVLDTVNANGHEILPPTTECVNTVKEVWDWLKLLNLVGTKEMPPVKMFTVPMEGGSITRGYYLDNVVYIHTDNPTDKKVILEELAHYITGASDCSRTFQDFAFRVGAALMNV